jgi:hypothetical protein
VDRGCALESRRRIAGDGLWLEARERGRHAAERDGLNGRGKILTAIAKSLIAPPSRTPQSAVTMWSFT